MTPLAALPTAVASGAPTPAGLAAARTAAQNFESFFLQQSFESMFQGIGNDTLFGGGAGESIYRSLLLQEYSKLAAHGGGVGIADAVQREILRAQEAK
jgi:peptidoglycan hydrolase FlgJ